MAGYELNEQISKLADEAGEFFRDRLSPFSTDTEIGTLGNENGTISVPGRGGFVYVTIQNAGYDYSAQKPVSREVIEVWNPRRISAEWGTEVRIGYAQEFPNHKIVLGVDFGQYGGPDQYRDESNPDDPPPNYLDRSIDKREIRQLNAHFKRSSGPFVIEVYRENVWDSQGVMKEFPTSEIDLAPLVPDQGELIATLWVNPNEAVPVLGYTLGETFYTVAPGGTSSEVPALEDVAPPVPDESYYIVAWVRLYLGQDKIYTSDLADARQVFQPVAGGGGIRGVIVTSEEGGFLIGDSGEVVIEG